MNKKSIIKLPEFEDYEIKISRKGEEFFLKIDELSIVSRGKALDKALEKLKQNFSESLINYKDSGYEESFPRPKKNINTNKAIYDLKIFFLKFLDFLFLSKIK